MEIVERENSEVKTTVSYRELKIAMDSEMGKAAESFVRIGYLFKMAWNAIRVELLWFLRGIPNLMYSHHRPLLIYLYKP